MSYTPESLETFHEVLGMLEEYDGLTALRIVEQLVARCAIELGGNERRARIIATGIYKHACEMIEDQTDWRLDANWEEDDDDDDEEEDDHGLPHGRDH